MAIARRTFSLDGNRALRVEFRVYPTLAAMRKACGIEDSYGCCAVELGGRPLALVYLTEVRHRYVSHEISHAAMAVADQRGNRAGTDEWEEDVAYATGELTELFWEWWNKQGGA